MLTMTSPKALIRLHFTDENNWTNWNCITISNIFLTGSYFQRCLIFLDNLSLPLLPVPVYSVGTAGQTAPSIKPYLRCGFQDAEIHNTSVLKQTCSYDQRSSVQHIHGRSFTLLFFILKDNLLFKQHPPELAKPNAVWTEKSCLSGLQKRKENAVVWEERAWEKYPLEEDLELPIPLWSKLRSPPCEIRVGILRRYLTIF